MQTLRRILVVDDDGDLREQLRALLERNGYDVVAVGSGADALAFLGRVPPPCLVLLDMNMDDMNGWEVLSDLRTRGLGDYPVIIVSGAPPKTIPRGAWTVLKKPFNSDEVLEAIASVREKLQQQVA